MSAPRVLIAVAVLAGLAVALRPVPDSPPSRAPGPAELPEPVVPHLVPASSRAAARELKLPDLQGRVVSLEDFRGKPVLLNFWATWCETCVEEMPVLERIHRAHKDRLVVLAASVDDDGRRSVLPFLAKNKVGFQVLLAGSRAGRDWVRGLPSLYLIDAEGRVAKTRFGAVPPMTLEADIEALLKLQRMKEGT